MTPIIGRLIRVFIRVGICASAFSGCSKGHIESPQAAACATTPSGGSESRPCYASDSVPSDQTCQPTTQTRICANGTWSPDYPPCDHLSCTVASCQPQCSGKLCGDDSCGGSCGTCASGTCNSSGGCNVSAPTAVPSIPTGLGVTAGDGQVSLTWDANPVADQVARYQVYRDDTLIADGPTTTDFVDTGLTDGITYTYRVSAWNTLGYGGWTSALNATPINTGPAVPSIPTGLVVTPGSTQVSLAWNANPPADQVARYQVYRDDTLIADGPTATSYADTGLTNGTTYTYRVSAWNTLGYGDWTVALSATPMGNATAVPSVPSGLAVTSGNAQVSLTWNANPAIDQVARYQIYRDGTKIADGPTATNYVDTGLTNGTTYTYQISAWNTLGYGSLTAAVNATPTVTTGMAPDAPRIASTNNGGSQSAASFSQAAADRTSKLHWTWSGFSYDNVGSACYGGSVGAFVDYVHAKSPIGTKVFRYYLPDTWTNGAFAAPLAAINTNNWWVYHNGTSGTKSANYWNASWGLANSTTYAPSDANGMKLEDWGAKFMLAWTNGTWPGQYAADAAPNIDGFAHDNFELRTPIGGYSSVNASNPADWSRDGVSDYQTQIGPPSGAQIDQAYRDGLARGVNYVRSHSNKLFIGNLAGWGVVATNGQNHISGTGVDIDADVTGLDHLAHGGLIEGWMGLSWCTESWGGFNDAKVQYQYCMKHVDQSTRYLVSAQHSVDANGLDYVSSANAGNRVTPWQAARYALCLVLQDDGSYNINLAISSYTNNTYGQLDWPWVDEFTVSSSEVALGEQAAGVGTGYGYMGQGIDNPWTRATNGVYWRRYLNASSGKTWIALVNPRGNGVQTITIAQINAAVGGAYVNFKKISGTQAPSVNSGATVTSVTLQDRDGLIARLL